MAGIKNTEEVSRTLEKPEMSEAQYDPEEEYKKLCAMCVDLLPDWPEKYRRRH
mgnify:CR=1 FL=1